MKLAPAHKSGAFSVLELIVVIVIVSMLLVLSMILPRMARSGPSAKVDRISCVNNLKQLGTAYHLWAEDHNGRFPASVSVTNDGWMEFLTNADQGFRCWTNFAIMKYELGQSPLIIVCPSDVRRPRGEGFFGSSQNGRGLVDSECNRMVSYFVGVSANLGNPQSLLAGDRNLDNGVKPAEDYGFSPENGKGDDVAIQINSQTGPVCWSLNMHSEGKSHGAGNILLADGSVQQVSTLSFRTNWQHVAGQTTNWPVGHAPPSASVRVLFP
jgi:prepilin-type processing-associated H-X9-DG protein